MADRRQIELISGHLAMLSLYLVRASVGKSVWPKQSLPSGVIFYVCAVSPKYTLTHQGNKAFTYRLVHANYTTDRL